MIGSTNFRRSSKAPRRCPHTAIVDGEAVVLDERGRSDFNTLLKDLGGRGGKRRSNNSILMAFDLLYLDGRDLRNLPWKQRRELLKELLSDQEGAIKLSEAFEIDGPTFFAAACEHELEGIVSKDVDSPYRSDRQLTWLKTKRVSSGNFVIVGFQRSAAPGHIGRLLLAARKGGELVYVGGVGTGFKHSVSRDLMERLSKTAIASPAAPVKEKGAVFVDPHLVAEIEFRAWTDDGKLRHASFKQLREPADIAEVFELLPSP